jgi:hypothetical protein
MVNQKIFLHNPFNKEIPPLNSAILNIASGSQKQGVEPEQPLSLGHVSHRV